MGVVVDLVKRKYADEIETMNECYIADKSKVLPIELKQARVPIEFYINNKERCCIVECIEYNQREEEKFIKLAQEGKDHELEKRYVKNLGILIEIMNKVNQNYKVIFDFWELDIFMSALELSIQKYELDWHKGNSIQILLKKVREDLLPIYNERKDYVFPTLKYLGEYE